MRQMQTMAPCLKLWSLLSGACF